MLTLNDGRSELWQWDTGRTLAVDADCSQVHFSNKVFGRSIDVDVVGGAAIIPDVLLQTDKDLNVWAFVGTAENGYTKISKTFKVNRRNKPADYVFTPTDQITLQTIQNQIGDLADLTTAAKDTLVAAINEAAASGGAGSMSLRVSGGYIQYSTDGGSMWQNLIAVADLKGDKGDTGPQGPKGATGATGATGEKGADGKSAYAYAVEGGYTGTEAEFAAKLAQEKFANPNALTFTGAVSGTYDGSAPLEVVIPSGGGGASDMTLLAEVDCSQVSGNIELTGLNDLTEIYITSDAVQSSHESINSGYALEINGAVITKNEFVPIYKSGYTAYVWVSIYYNGCVWAPIKSAGTNSKINYGLSYTNINAPYNLIEGVGKAKKLRLVSPLSQYQAISGTIKIYGR